MLHMYDSKKERQSEHVLRTGNSFGGLLRSLNQNVAEDNNKKLCNYKAKFQTWVRRPGGCMCPDI